MVKVDLQVEDVINLISDKKKADSKKLLDGFDKEELVNFLLEDNCVDGKSNNEEEDDEGENGDGEETYV